MTHGTQATQDQIILGKTHFQIPGYNEVIPFSKEAIESDRRWPEIQEEMIKKLEEKSEPITS